MKEYAFENLPFISSNPPNRIKEYQCEIPLEIISEYLNNDYQLILQTSVFPSRRKLHHLEVIEKNQFFNLIRVDKLTFNTQLGKFIEENEYVNGFNFFLMKDVTYPVFQLPLSSRDTIKITNLTNNHLVFVQIESYDVKECFWN